MFSNNCSLFEGLTVRKALTQVTNQEPFDIVFTFVRHPYFGIIIEANAVKLLPNGNYSLSFQRIRPNTCSYYNLSEKQTEAVGLLEDFEVDNIIKKHYSGSKRIRNNEFFLKHYTPELHKIVREGIEKRLIKILELIKGYPLFMMGKSGNPIETKIEFTEEAATVLFHFRRNEEGTNYFATIKQHGVKVNFYQNNSEIITSKPAWILAENKLLHFYNSVDGQKLKPFLNKKYIHIEPHQEKSYMDKFVKPLLQNHDVYAEGFTIQSEYHKATPLLKLVENVLGGFCLSLYFKYANWSFPYHATTQVNVSLEKTTDGYLFHKIRRSRNWEEEKIRLLRELGLENNQGSIFTTAVEENASDYGIFEWLNQHAETLQRSGFIVEQNAGVNRYFVGSVNLEIKVNQKNDWFDVFAVVKFGKFEIPFIKLKKHILEKKREFVLPDNTIAILPEAWFSKLEQLAHFGEIEGKNLRLKNMHFGILDNLDEFIEVSSKKREQFKIFKVDKIPNYAIPTNFHAELRDYQLEGFRWMVYLHENHMGALLADDMGLGKTVQTLALIDYQREQNILEKKQAEKDRLLELQATVPAGHSLDLFASEKPKIEENKTDVIHQLNLFDSTSAKSAITIEPEKLIEGPTLVIAPKSLLHNWQTEAKKFAPHLKVLIYSGIQRSKFVHKLDKYDMVIMSYGTMRNDLEQIKKYKFLTLVIDESQAIKNPGSQTARALLQLKSRHRVALTGTPIENTLLDVWSQMQFLNHGLLGTYSYFEKNFLRAIEKADHHVQQTHQKTKELRAILDPFILRRTKKQVAKELPEKIEKVHYCEMTEEQKEIYQQTLSQYRNEILSHIQNQGIEKSRLKIFNGLMHLRQLALNPLLKEEEFSGLSGKDEEIHRMLLRAIEGGHKILLFSQFVMYLKLFEQFLKEENIPYAYLDGSMDENARKKQIELFQTNQEVKVFLLSLRAGNTGLNLTEADYVFLADPWWNPFTMRQAEDRAHRIGQDKTVFSYKFITKDTIEEKILKLQEKKTRLAGNIIPDEESILGAITENELMEILC